jgi:hypothetical protein
MSSVSVLGNNTKLGITCVDVVFYVYYENSLKVEIMRKRGMGGRRKVTAYSRPPKAWSTFLRCDENKTELFGFLADKLRG